LLLFQYYLFYVCAHAFDSTFFYLPALYLPA